jgi:hypothetical protein
MIKNIIDLLIMDEYYGVSKNIDIAKGIHSIPKSYKEIIVLWKRQWKSKS